MKSVQQLLDACRFPAAGESVDLAVSGGPDSLGLLLLALDANLSVRVHHVDHHTRAGSTVDAEFVLSVGAALDVPVEVHDVVIAPGGNYEARARSERRRILPRGALTGHTMDDLAETVLLNMIRGAGLDGLSPLVNDPTKPMVRLRRADVAELVAERGLSTRHDESNDDLSFRRNRVRHQLIPLLCEVAERDVVPLLARQAEVLFDDRNWLAALVEADGPGALEEVDCRQLREWPRARLRRWLRTRLSVIDELGEQHPPSSAEIERALGVVDGDVVAVELEGGRRLSRRAQHLSLEGGSATLTPHG
ncbi:MAG: tRNA lysidine(34) synthetase TilS [Acidimicrobiales bacterium]